MSPQASGQLRVALAQINPTVGALESNSNLIFDYAQKAVTAGAHLLVLPEMVLTGYPVEDLAKPLAKRSPFWQSVLAHVEN